MSSSAATYLQPHAPPLITSSQLHGCSPNFSALPQPLHSHPGPIGSTQPARPGHGNLGRSQSGISGASKAPCSHWSSTWAGHCPGGSKSARKHLLSFCARTTDLLTTAWAVFLMA